MEVYDLIPQVNRQIISRLDVTHLVPPLVPDQDYEGSVVLFDIVGDECGYSRVKLFTHEQNVQVDVSFPVKRVTGTNFHNCKLT